MKKIDWSKTSLGIELGSTRIKMSIIDVDFKIVADSSSTWENKFINGIWTYSLDEIKSHLQEAYKNLKDNVKKIYGETLTEVGSIGVSAMMHGYMTFDKNDNLLVPFRTWRNNNALLASDELTKIFNYHIPARWSIAHLYQAILDKEEHINKISFMTTLSGYIHYVLTGEKVLGIDDASGMFPIDPKTKQFDTKMLQIFDEILLKHNLNYKLEEIFPTVLLAGTKAGNLTKEGAVFLDHSNDLKAGIPLCPPEGDAATGMVCTNSILPLTGNISAGTSIFGMVVLNKKLNNYYPEIDIVTTPVGDEVAMVHCNNCTSEINSWVNLFYEFSTLLNSPVKKDEIYSILFNHSLDGDNDCGNLLTYNYTSGENITNITNGRPLFLKTANSNFNLSNFMKAQIYSSFATLKYGFDKLFNEENIKVNNFYAAGGIFKTKGVADKYLAAAMNAPITLLESANEGGSYGMAILASYLFNTDMPLADYLNLKIFKDVKSSTAYPEENLVEGFKTFEKRYIEGLKIEKEADKWGD